MNIEGVKNYTKNNIILVGLIFTLLVTMFFRFKGLTSQSYWLDEIWSAYISKPDRSFISMYSEVSKDVHPPLFQIILWGWYHIVGFNEYAGRFLSAIFGSLSVLAIFFLGKELFNKEIGLYASIIASVNWFLVYYSQEVRSYSLLFLMSIISYTYLVKMLNKHSKTNIFLYLISTICLMYTHFFGLIIIATQMFVVIYYVYKEENEKKRLVVLASIIAMVFIVALLPLLPQIMAKASLKSFWISKPTSTFILSYMDNYVKNKYLEGIFLLTSLFAISYLFTKKYIRSIRILFIWIILGFLLPYIRSITATPILTDRNTIIIIPALILLISYGIFLLKDRILKICTLVLILILSIYQLSASNYHQKNDYQQWREILNTLSQSKNNFPVYDLAFKGKFYKTYAAMLDMNLNIYSHYVLKSQHKTHSIPVCFWTLEAHGKQLSKFKEVEGELIQQAFQIRKSRVRATLFANNINPSICRKMFLGPPVIKTDWSIYLNGKQITYVKAPCTQEDTSHAFYLHVYPKDKTLKFKNGNSNNKNMDFRFNGLIKDDSCVETKTLPDFEIKSIDTGQYSVKYDENKKRSFKKHWRAHIDVK